MLSQRCLSLLALGSFGFALASGACGGSTTNASNAGARDVGAEGGDTGGQDDEGAVVAAGRVPKRHRPTAAACEVSRPPTTPVAADAGGDDSLYKCRSDADCTAGKEGRCTHFPPGEYHECTYATCTGDSDCANGKICECNVPYVTTACLPTSDCHVDADCGPSGYCSPTAPVTKACGKFGVAPEPSSYACHTTADTCLDDSDCPDDPKMNGSAGYCAYDATVKHWRCAISTCYDG